MSSGLARVDVPAVEDGDVWAVAEVGRGYLELGQLALAEALFGGLVHLRPAEAWLRLAHGVALDRLGRVEQADAAYREAARLDPGEPLADLNRAGLALAAGERERARRLLEGAGKKAKRRGDLRLGARVDALRAQVEGRR